LHCHRFLIGAKLHIGDSWSLKSKKHKVLEAIVDELKEKSVTSGCNLDALMIQKGKNISLSTSHEMANNAKHRLALNSFSEYLKTFAASIRTSLASWRARIIEPTRKNLFHQ
jgi:uncharacterized protein YlxP (DUF503 family)